MVRRAQPRFSPSTPRPAWIFHRQPTGRSKIAQFKEVIKTVHNQYLSLDGHTGGGLQAWLAPPLDQHTHTHGVGVEGRSVLQLLFAHSC